MTQPYLKPREQFLLEWLAMPGPSVLGEAKGQSLDRLIELGLASVADPANDYGAVRLTDAGRSWLAAKERG
jgi:hypothetical protein